MSKSRISTKVGDREVAIFVEGDSISIAVEGFGVSNMEPGEGCVVAVDLWSGDEEDEKRAPHVYIWGDVRKEEYTHSISLEGAMERRRAD